MTAVSTEAWVLAGAPAPAQLQTETFRFDFDPASEVLIEPLYGCWDDNLALARQSVVGQRKEARVQGPAGVARVLQAPPASGLTEGQICLLLTYARLGHPLGDPRAALADDAPGMPGLLAKRAKADPSQLLPLPADTPYSLPQWAGFALSYVTAWGNWQIAQAAYRALVPVAELPDPWVLAWGGGVAVAELQLAAHDGFHTAMFTSRHSQAGLLESHGILPLMHDNQLSDAASSAEYQLAEQHFLAQIQALTGGRMAGIFVDLIGGPLWKATLKALACPGVLTTAGRKHSTSLNYQRALTCLNWQVFVHTHAARPSHARAALAFALEHSWLPPEPARIWQWHEIPELAASYTQGLDDYFPIFAIS